MRCSVLLRHAQRKCLTNTCFLSFTICTSRAVRVLSTGSDDPPLSRLKLGKTIKPTSSVYVCHSCGAHCAQWVGRCDQCGTWGSVEAKSSVSSAMSSSTHHPPLHALKLSSIESKSLHRLQSGIIDFDRVLGGGMVPGSFILLGGDPGAGKSTLMLQTAAALARKQHSVLYVTGEETVSQVAMRAKRVLSSDGSSTDLSTLSLYISCDNRLRAMSDAARHAKLMNSKYSMIVIDSIQTLQSEHAVTAPGSVSQLREVSASLLSLAKELETVIVAIGHITKDGSIAGPRLLEHLVDVVLYFERPQYGDGLMLLRNHKNRFGATQEVGVFQMQADGLVCVSSPSAALLSNTSHWREGVPPAGTALSATLHGSRAFLVEVQALVAGQSRTYGNSQWSPQPQVTGLGMNRSALVVTVVDKYLHSHIASRPLFLNATGGGGVKVDEAAIDVALAAALFSAAEQRPVPPNSVWLGEIGLAGEIRAVHGIENRVMEAISMGLNHVFLPVSNLAAVSREVLRRHLKQVKLLPLQHVSQLKEYI